MNFFTLLLTVCVLLQACIGVDLVFIQGNPIRSIFKTTVEDLNSNTKSSSDELNHIADLEAKNSELEKQNQDLLNEKQELASNQERLEKEITSLRAEMECMLQELQAIMDVKLSLELEVAAYRKILEGEEDRVGLREIVEHPTILTVPRPKVRDIGMYSVGLMFK